jgi:7-cyano-7-deazaguanine synthase
MNDIPKTDKECIIIMSGGMDSAVSAAYAKKNYRKVHALTFSYGQRNTLEIESAYSVSHALEISSHEPIQTAYKVLQGSALFGPEDIPRYLSMDHFQDEQETTDKKLYSTFVPGRNTFFFNIAANRVYQLNSRYRKEHEDYCKKYCKDNFQECMEKYEDRVTDILMGVSASDSDFPDCRKDFLQKQVPVFYSLAITGNPTTFRCVLPLIDKTKAQIVLEAKEAFGDRFEYILELTHTCYFPNLGGCCGPMCRACLFRAEGFKLAGIKDPIAKFRDCLDCGV